MTRLPRVALAVYLLSALTSTVVAQSSATAVQVAGPIVTLDCYDTLGLNSDEETVATFQTDGLCQETCTRKNAKVMITSGGNSCFCGDSIPSPSHKLDSDQCNLPCGGYKFANCGGLETYQYYLTSLGTPTVEKDNSTSSAKPSTTASPSNTAPAVVTSAAPTQSPESSGGSSKVGIAVGVVVGVVAVAAIAGAGVFFWRRRRNQRLEEEHARTAAINGFAKGPKSEASSANDSRLDPSIYSARRDSLGSIADERDFSRRILQVRNPDRESRASHV